jgi:hypothetical protein
MAVTPNLVHASSRQQGLRHSGSRAGRSEAQMLHRVAQ